MMEFAQLLTLIVLLFDIQTKERIYGGDIIFLKLFLVVIGSCYPIFAMIVIILLSSVTVDYLREVTKTEEYKTIPFKLDINLSYSLLGLCILFPIMNT